MTGRSGTGGQQVCLATTTPVEYQSWSCRLVSGAAVPTPSSVPLFLAPLFRQPAHVTYLRRTVPESPRTRPVTFPHNHTSDDCRGCPLGGGEGWAQRREDDALKAAAVVEHQRDREPVIGAAWPLPAGGRVLLPVTPTGTAALAPARRCQRSAPRGLTSDLGR